ncbi:hypothetical protein LWI28_028688 [Acer negundo]|uniref:Uncharacterized protein n=1 Tax=Acer negundo TaxID=4023 RepID=A0AAD5JHP4_ACENE|nr:hypothetical protein LWI28_028688 [Acer negundo]
MKHEGLLPSIHVIQTNLRAHLEIFANLAQDLDTFLNLGVSFRLWKAPKIQTMVGPVPSPHLIKVNSAAYGVVFRSSGGDFIGCFAMKIGCNTSFFAELSAVIIEDGQCFGSKKSLFSLKISSTVRGTTSKNGEI